MHFDWFFDLSLRVVQQARPEKLEAVFVIQERLFFEFSDLLFLAVDELFVAEEEVVEAFVEVVRGFVGGWFEGTLFEVQLLGFLHETVSLHGRAFVEAFVDGVFGLQVGVDCFSFDLDDLVAAAVRRSYMSSMAGLKVHSDWNSSSS